jgi:hypothetical protein
MDVAKHAHLQPQLQFICGLGPRKAHDLLEKITTRVLRGDQEITERLDLTIGEYL